MERWRVTDKRREGGGGRLESGAHGYKDVAGRKVNRTGESFVPVTSWWNVSRNFCSGNWRSIVMQEVACRTRKTEETLSNSFLNAHLRPPLRLCSRGKLYVLRVRLFEYTSVHSVPRSNRRESSSARGRHREGGIRFSRIFRYWKLEETGMVLFSNSSWTNLWISIYIYI